jgi:hypothetical protein
MVYNWVQVYIAGTTSPAANRRCIEELLQKRHHMAHMLGAPSYAHYVADSTTLAANPRAVKRFLAALSEANKPKVGFKEPRHPLSSVLFFFVRSQAFVLISTQYTVKGHVGMTILRNVSQQFVMSDTHIICLMLRVV